MVYIRRSSEAGGREKSAAENAAENAAEKSAPEEFPPPGAR
ncbi:MAG: hypothetical protein ACOCYG_06610 [Spirochaetota bacterium]